ncbi:hypothetical protein C5167_007666 [Papaver somniferum]|nr:hypothetical protein C5167_007666 [Papaver somniferum]
MRLNFEFNFSVVSNVNGSYYTYSLYNKSTIHRFVMDISGQIKSFKWSESKRLWDVLYVQPRRLCEVYSACGPFGNCNPDTWKCECLPGSVPRFLTDWNLRDSTGGLAAAEIRSIAPIPSSPVPVSTAQARKRKAIVWKIVLPIFILVGTIMGILGYIYLLKRNKANKRGRLKGLQGVLTDLWKSKSTYNDSPNTNMFVDGETEGETQELQIFKLACLTLATNNFCLKNKLGEGGFGPVYKLYFPCMFRLITNQIANAANPRISVLTTDPRKKAQVDWDKRINIIGGVARGLLYLHRDSRLRVIHRDLKVSNILLDENMIPKISDFGMARIFGGDQAIANTSKVVGTVGYMSPEYIMGGTFSEKSDVFSFGVLILEIVSGKRNNSFYNPEQPLNLLLHTWRLWNEGKWSEVVDEGLGDLYSPSEVIKCIHIGMLCVQNRAIDRPTMAEVDNMLGNETDRPAPKEPPYTFPASSDKSGFQPNHCSNNNVTVTAVEGR